MPYAKQVRDNILIEGVAGHNLNNQLSYSYIMRQLNKNDPEKMKEFQKAFKKAFDEAYLNNIEDLSSVALLQAIQDSNIDIAEINKEANIEYSLLKTGQMVMELGSPEVAGRAIAAIIRFLLKRISVEKLPNNLMALKQKILTMRENEMSLKKSPPTAALGQSLTLIKTLLNGKDPNYIRRTLEHIVGNLHI